MIDDDTGGDDACWLSMVCPECGAMLEDRAGACWRCGVSPTAETE